MKNILTDLTNRNIYKLSFSRDPAHSTAPSPFRSLEAFNSWKGLCILQSEVIQAGTKQLRFKDYNRERVIHERQAGGKSCWTDSSDLAILK